jgi:hypothetical protein
MIKLETELPNDKIMFIIKPNVYIGKTFAVSISVETHYNGYKQYSQWFTRRTYKKFLKTLEDDANILINSKHKEYGDLFTYIIKNNIKYFGLLNR